MHKNIVTYFAMITHNRAFESLDVVKNIYPYVDHLVIIDGGSTDGTLEGLRKIAGEDLVEWNCHADASFLTTRKNADTNKKMHIVHREWQDNFPKQRQTYVDMVGLLRKNDEHSWLIVSDSVSKDTIMPFRFVDKNRKCNFKLFSIEDAWDHIVSNYKHTIIKEGDKEKLIFDGTVKTISYSDYFQQLSKVTPSNINKNLELHRYGIFSKLTEDTKKALINLSLYGTNKRAKINDSKISLSTLKQLNKKIEKGLVYDVEPEFKKINYLIRHITDKKLYRVAHKNFVVDVTEDHSLMQLDNNELKEATCRELSNDSVIPVIRRGGNKLFKEVRKIKLSNFINSDEIEVEGKWLKLKRRDNKKYRILNELEGEQIKNFCKVGGFYVGEGHCSDRDVGFSNNDETLIKSIDGFIQSFSNTGSRGYFGSNEKDEYDPTYFVRYNSKLFRIVFRELFGEGHFNKKLPDFVYFLNEDLKNCIIEWMVKGDGSANKFGQRSYTTISRKLANSLCTLLFSMDRDYEINYNHKKGSFQIALDSKFEKFNNNYNIVPLSNSKDYVYDIGIENKHVFVSALGFPLLHNSDEFLSERLRKQLKPIITQYAEPNRLTMLKIRAKDIELDPKDNSIVSKNLADYWKELIYKWHPNLKIVGDHVHEGFNMGFRTQLLPDNVDKGKEFEILYEHRKRGSGVIWERAHLRNFFIRGGGPNLGERQKLWKPFREMIDPILVEFHGITQDELRWHHYKTYVKTGNIDRKLFLWYIRYMLEGIQKRPDYLEFEYNYENIRIDLQPSLSEYIMGYEYDGASEVREGALLYFTILFPEQCPEKLKLIFKDYLGQNPWNV